MISKIKTRSSIRNKEIVLDSGRNNDVLRNAGLDTLPGLDFKILDVNFIQISTIRLEPVFMKHFEAQ